MQIMDMVQATFLAKASQLQQRGLLFWSLKRYQYSTESQKFHRFRASVGNIFLESLLWETDFFDPRG